MMIGTHLLGLQAARNPKPQIKRCLILSVEGPTLRFLGGWNPKKSVSWLWEASRMMRYGMWLTQDKSTSQHALVESGESGEQRGRDGNT